MANQSVDLDFLFRHYQQSILLEPLEADVKENKKKYSELQKKMNELKDECDLSFALFLQTVANMTKDEYIKYIRASLKGPNIFLRRHPSEMRVNYYNPYNIVSCISKSQRGISAMLEKASQEAAEGNMDLKHQVRHIGNKFLNFVEVSAQEASYLIL